MTPRRMLLAVWLIAGLAPGVAAAQSRTETVMLGELRQSMDQMTRLTTLVNQLADQVRALEKRIADQESGTVKGFADQRLQITALTSTITTMREKLDDSALRTTQTTQEIAAVREGVRMLTDQVNLLIGLLQPPTGATGEPGAPTGAKIGPVAMPPSPASLMTPAMADRFAGRYDLAIAGFEEVIKTFPQSPESAKAQFFIGECYREGKKFKEAIAAYDKTIANYKDTDYARDALLMKGNAFLEWSRRADAEAAFRSVMKQFPNTSQALQAEQRLKFMGVIKN